MGSRVIYDNIIMFVKIKLKITNTIKYQNEETKRNPSKYKELPHDLTLPVIALQSGIKRSPKWTIKEE